ncbi:hypothetical protein M378DRAFT_157121 [Amanita muscaria Koide BX008]|uniref:Uncharacterized protein n=1 Tax=Amanita muscaria (strain Koide BX008) TaxID=946122 RepID=A0A0C2XK42_AMAMK|nr:hypothetical protein M378DRAFT_157121 [Amanita muscaria Koide BX008]
MANTPPTTPPAIGPALEDLLDEVGEGDTLLELVRVEVEVAELAVDSGLSPNVYLRNKRINKRGTISYSMIARRSRRTHRMR